MAQDKFLDLYFGNSDSDAKFKTYFHYYVEFSDYLCNDKKIFGVVWFGFMAYQLL